MSAQHPAEVLLGLGANLGDPVGQLAQAVRRLAAAVEGLRVSSVYRTEPVGYADQPDFFNLVCRGYTRLRPRELLHELRAVEAELGRARSFANAPRSIDVDLLDFQGERMETPELTLPHPRLHQRAFVLIPLAEVAPEWKHPLLGRTAAELLRELDAAERVERWGPLPVEEVETGERRVRNSR